LLRKASTRAKTIEGINGIKEEKNIEVKCEGKNPNTMTKVKKKH
jgi:hypothetical protein